MRLALSPDKRGLLNELSNSWPAKYQLKIEDNELADFQSHPLAEEIVAIVKDRACSLPYFLDGQTEIVWFSIAQDADDLQATIQMLRCWLIPSFGWEDSRGWIVTDGGSGTSLAKHLSELSPAGYCRWRSRQLDFGTIAEKLARIRFLEKARPVLPPNGPPPLIQIRQQFVTALVAGDKTSAENAIRLVESHQLDTADNSLFMRIRLWSTFREFDRIVRHKDILRLTQLRAPRVVQQAIIRAFYSTFVEEFDWKNEIEHILTAYRLEVHNAVGSLIRRSSNDSGIEITRLRACYAVITEDQELALELTTLVDDVELANRLKLIGGRTIPEPEPSLEEQFLLARLKKDWNRLQDVGVQLLEVEPKVFSPLLRQSLEFLPNSELENKLNAIQAGVKQAGETHKSEAKAVPASWTQWLQAVASKEDADFSSFLAERHDLFLDETEPQAIVDISDHLESIYLNTDFSSDVATRQLLLTGLPELMQDFVNEPAFPRDRFVPVYTNLFRLWSDLKLGSVHPPDSQVLLNLADGILSFNRDFEQDIVSQFDSWWNKSPVKAMLPFLLGVVDLLNAKGTEAQCSNFWITGATYIQSSPNNLTLGERKLWRQIGSQFFDSLTIDEYLPLPASDVGVDPLRQANLQKVAIVSMRERQASEAAAMISERSGAETVIVADKVAGAATNNAITADVVLFVWSATSHAVFRAFDGLERQKLAYVQGTGAGSILLALERWVEMLGQPRSLT